MVKFVAQLLPTPIRPESESRALICFCSSNFLGTAEIVASAWPQLNVIVSPSMHKCWIFPVLYFELEYRETR